MRIQLAAVAALVVNFLVLALFVVGTFAPGWFPHAMTHPPTWFWPTAIGCVILLLFVVRTGTMRRDARAARSNRPGGISSR